jgi:hypothetical protein
MQKNLQRRLHCCSGIDTKESGVCRLQNSNSMKCSKLLVSVFGLLHFISCTMTTTTPKDPVFSGDLSTLKEKIDSIIKCDSVVLGGKEINTNGNISYELGVEIVNPEIIPSDKTQLRNIAIQIAKLTKETLKDPNSINIYRIVLQYHNQGIINNWKLFRTVVIKSDQL